MNSELNNTVNDATERQMMADWTSSLLRQRSRPMRVPARDQWRFAEAPSLGAACTAHRSPPPVPEGV